MNLFELDRYRLVMLAGTLVTLGLAVATSRTVQPPVARFERESRMRCTAAEEDAGLTIRVVDGPLAAEDDTQDRIDLDGCVPRCVAILLARSAGFLGPRDAATEAELASCDADCKAATQDDERCVRTGYEPASE